jgi:hypothetical protein
MTLVAFLIYCLFGAERIQQFLCPHVPVNRCCRYATEASYIFHSIVTAEGRREEVRNEG